MFAGVTSSSRATCPNTEMSRPDRLALNQDAVNKHKRTGRSAGADCLGAADATALIEMG